MKKGVIALFVSVLFLAVALSGCIQRSYCGNGVCETTGIPPETAESCPADCGPTPECIKEGEKGIEGEDECCEGLTEINDCDADENTCACAIDRFVCSYCGNGECGLGENTCNCPADCKPALKSCLEQGGDICTIEEICKGEWLPASDSNRCCSEQCVSEGVCDNDFACEAGENFENCSNDCYPSQIRVEGSLTVGTTEPVFSVGEKIELKPFSGAAVGIGSVGVKSSDMGGEKINEFIHFKDGKKIVFLVPETDETVSYSLIDSALPKMVSSAGQTIYPSSIEVEPGKERYIVELKQKSLVDYAIDVLGKQKILDDAYSKQLHDILLQYKPVVERIQNNAINSIKNTLGKEAVLESRQLSDETKLVVRNKFRYVMNAIVLDLTEEEVKKIEANPFVKAVFESKPVYATLPDAVKEIKADKAWNVPSPLSNTTTGKGISIGIIDTGIDYTHPDLGGCLGPSCKVKGGFDLVNRDNDPMDDMGHGTHVASIAAGNGLLLGIAPDAELYGIKVLDAYGSGSWETVIAGIEWAMDPNKDNDFSDHLDVINMSLGSFGDPDDKISRTIDKAVDAGIVAVVAAGNSGPGGRPDCRHEGSGSSNSICSPGTARKAITVGAECRVEQSDVSGCYRRVGSFSSRGPVGWIDSEGNLQEIMKPDVVAPGVLICAARYNDWFEEGEHPLYKPCIDDQHVLLSGTSMASPVVAGATALILESNPSLTPLQVKQLLKNSAVNLGLEENVQGAGLVDVVAAIGEQPIIIVEPAYIFFQSNVLSAITEVEKQFELKNNSASTKSFELSLDSDPKKLTTSFSQQIITLNAGESRAITAMFSINNLEAASGELLRANIIVAESGSIVGKTPVRINVKERIAASVKSIEAYDSPNNESYYEKFIIKIQNLMQDTAQEFDTTVGQWEMLGIEGFVGLEPTLLLLSPGSAADLNLAIRIPENKAVPNGFYKGKIILESNLQRFEIPVELIKKFVLEVKTDYRPLYIAIFDSGDESIKSLVPEKENTIDENHYVYYSDFPDEKSIIAHIWFYSQERMFETKFIVRENLLPEYGKPVIISHNDAKNRVFFNYVDAEGTPFYDATHNRFLGERGNYWFHAEATCRGYCTSDTYAKVFISDINSNWVFFNAIRSEDNEKGTVHQFIKTTEGAVNKDYEFSASQSDYRKNFIYPNRKGLETLTFHSFYFEKGGWGRIYHSFPFNRIPRYFINANEFGNEFFGFTMGLRKNKDSSKHVLSPLNFYYGDKIYSKPAPFGSGKTLEPYDYNKTFFGFAPLYWSAKFANKYYMIWMYTNYTDEWLALFLGQAQDRFNLGNAVFKLYDQDHRFIREDEIYISMVGYSPFEITFDVPIAEQKYFFEGEMQYDIDGTNYDSKIVLFMDLGASDRNPPYFKSLKVLRNGNISSYAENGTEIEFEAVDEISAVSFEATVNGTLSTILSRGNKKYLVLGGPANGLYEIAIKASDATGNFIEYTFQVPVYYFLSDESKIINSDSSLPLEGWLEIKIVKPDGSEEVIVNKPVSIAAGETRDISQYFNAANISFAEPGEYEIRARLHIDDWCIRTPDWIMFLATQLFEVK